MMIRPVPTNQPAAGGQRRYRGHLFGDSSDLTMARITFQLEHGQGSDEQSPYVKSVCVNDA